jgi:CRP-like cAMP-binding protein
MVPLTPCVFAEVSPKDLDEVGHAYPRIRRALRMSSLARMSTQLEWTLNIGQRTAHERLGLFLCELFFRQRALGLSEGDACPLPLTQGEIADALGITNVHVNRTLQSMRKQNLLDLRGRRLIIRKLEHLIDASMFNPAYLHPKAERRSPLPRIAGGFHASP